MTIIIVSVKRVEKTENDVIVDFYDGDPETKYGTAATGYLVDGIIDEIRNKWPDMAILSRDDYFVVGKGRDVVERYLEHVLPLSYIVFDKVCAEHRQSVVENIVRHIDGKTGVVTALAKTAMLEELAFQLLPPEWCYTGTYENAIYPLPVGVWGYGWNELCSVMKDKSVLNEIKRAVRRRYSKMSRRLG